jgi:hypothetical protein
MLCCRYFGNKPSVFDSPLKAPQYKETSGFQEVISPLTCRHTPGIFFASLLSLTHAFDLHLVKDPSNPEIRNGFRHPAPFPAVGFPCRWLSLRLRDGTGYEKMNRIYAGIPATFDREES